MEKTKNFFKRIGQAFHNEFVGTWQGIAKERITFPILLLVVVNVVCLLVSNIIAAKTIVFGTVGNIKFQVPCAVLMYMFAVIISDVLCQIDPSNKWTRRSCHMGFLLNLVMVATFELSIVIPGVGDLSVLHSAWFN